MRVPRAPVDVDAILLDRTRMQAVTRAGEQSTAIPGTESKARPTSSS